MKPKLLQQLILYRYRYIVGYGLLVIFAVAMLTWQLSSIGPGLAPSERASAFVSATWHWDWQQWQHSTLQIVNLPYIILQKLSIAGFGLSTLSIRLPSAIIGILTSGMFILLMRRLYRPHVAVIASGVFIGSSWFMALARFGTPYIMIPLVWILAIYAFVRLIRLDKLGFAWAILAAIAASLALYTPYGIYVLVTGLAVVFVHPTARRAITGLSGPQVVLGLFILIPLAIPFGWGLYQTPAQAWELAGLSSHLPTVHQFAVNVAQTVSAVVWRAPILPELRLANLPLIGIGSSALLVAGLYRCLRDWRAMRTQFVLINIVVVLLLIGLNTGNKSYAGLLVPIFLLISMGVTVLFREWYKLFPRNPYARSFALIPITIFLALVVTYSYQKYFVAWARSPQTYQAYSTDTELVRQQVQLRPNLTLVVPADDVAWYSLLQRHYPKLAVSTVLPPPPASAPILQSARLSISPATTVVTPITNDSTQDSLRFWLVMPPS